MMEVFKMLPEGTLAEIINGSIYMSPSPTTKHQIILRQLAFVIFDFVKHKKKGAEVFFHLMTCSWMSTLMQCSPISFQFQLKINPS